jgi:hypothetical protein
MDQPSPHRPTACPPVPIGSFRLPPDVAAAWDDRSLPPPGFRFREERDGRQIRRFLIHARKRIGEAQVEKDSPLADRMPRCFPGLVTPGETLLRLQSIGLDEPYWGNGFGKLLYLDLFRQVGRAWLANSQLGMYEPPHHLRAIWALESLAKGGLVELHWKDEPGGYFACRATPVFLRRLDGANLAALPKFKERRAGA